jgi:hypothetical protein
MHTDKDKDMDMDMVTDTRHGYLHQTKEKTALELAPVLIVKLKKSCLINNLCSLSLWRAVRGSKPMHLELIHGLFIT